ncbi:SDR family NAD(P)-dependent oxidoreductase [Halomonas heilongjiangensis]|uniref:Short-chain dehydrogenase n=1 Tax=Halomonas heilongjiangensis TaxID=1387883 RepID=A0A2N7TG44_9GAMM|nr:SDR family NAD(P)-dependent oxidoreductase [Halomonas heilongjiangensis]PMR67153.1 short-chain dehydrogenase [Halomonas heilongjiangensis]PXX87892.1 short-chain dehydrogenase [Halomonas heilongjiangensis]
MTRFHDKVAVVTGGGGGIGSAICRRLAEEGAAIVVVDRDEASAMTVKSDIEASGGRAVVMVADIADEAACRRLVDNVMERCGRLDVLVNNAGINRRGDISEVSTADWHLSFDVNIHSMFYLCRAAVPHMQRAGRGVIVNTASQWGLYPAPGHIAYNVTKAAVVAFSKSLARDLACHNIRVNAVCPGEIHTPMLATGLEKAGKTVRDLDRLVPFGRIGTPEEVAALVAFLGYDEAPFLCGSAVEITGAQAVS